MPGKSAASGKRSTKAKKPIPVDTGVDLQVSESGDVGASNVPVKSADAAESTQHIADEANNNLQNKGSSKAAGQKRSRNAEVNSKQNETEKKPQNGTTVVGNVESNGAASPVKENTARKPTTDVPKSTAGSGKEGNGGKGSNKNSGNKSDANKQSGTSKPPAKKQKQSSIEVEVPVPCQPGFVLVVGEGDTGQLGLGPDVMDRSKAARVNLPASVIQICAGGMHSVCVTLSGEVYTFGCNDEGALGRKTEDEDECMSPDKVDLGEKIVMVSAGDSHTAALSDHGRVFIWGTFRDSNGPIGIQPGKEKINSPLEIMKEHRTVKVASGSDHLVCLTDKGQIYTLGAAEQGQLGRVAEKFVHQGGRRGLGKLLTPDLVTFRARNARFCDIWTGGHYTFAKEMKNGDIYAWGLNNYYQLGIDDMENKFIPVKCSSFDKSKNWIAISGGQHHTLALDGSGQVYSLGRKEYGRLGLGEKDLEEKTKPTPISKLQHKCVGINCGTAVSYAVSDDGTIFGWGMGSTKQLGQGDDEDDVYEPIIISGKQLENKKGLMASAGGQHTLFLAQDKS